MLPKEKVPKKKCSLTLSVQRLETFGIWLVPSDIQQELKTELLTLQFANHAEFLSALEIFTVAPAIKNKIY